MEGNFKKWINRINSKQNVLTEDNVGQFMDVKLSMKSTPTSGDTVLGRDSLTGKAVEIPTSSLGGNGSKTTFTHDILVSNWSLVLGKYEAVISNSGILSNSFVDVIPSNDHVDIVRNAQIYPSVLISEGSVKVYSKFLPSGTISVTVNII